MVRTFPHLACAALALLACSPAQGDKEASVMDGFANQADAAAADAGAANLKAAEDFLATNKTAAGVVVTQTGLQYASLASGPADGQRPGPDSIVQVNYEGKLLNGTVFDSSFARGQAAEFRVSDLVPSWVEALQLMRPGDEWTIWVHPNLGYGQMGSPPDIPPNALLVFRMRLEKIVAGPGSEAAGAGAKAEAGATK
jgi:FKBP-type peptidyl-prolyl cis-trans isomerase